MKPLLLLSALFLFGCQSPTQPTEPEQTYVDLTPSTDTSYLIRISEGESYEPGTPCGYVNQQGDTVIPLGKYRICWTDTIRTFGIVTDDRQGDPKLLAIDRKEQILYEVYFYDNGPDWPEDGLFRILRNGKIGYADEDGFIRIPPQFACAFPFSNGVAKVSLHCELIPDGEHTRMESDRWFFIDTEGKVVKE